MIRARWTISKNTATGYLNEQVNVVLLSETKVGKEIINKNNVLYHLIEKW